VCNKHRVLFLKVDVLEILRTRNLLDFLRKSSQKSDLEVAGTDVETVPAALDLCDSFFEEWNGKQVFDFLFVGVEVVLRKQQFHLFVFVHLECRELLGNVDRHALTRNVKLHGVLILVYFLETFVEVHIKFA